MVSSVGFDVVRGLPWKRLLMVKNRRTRRVEKPKNPKAMIRTSALTKASISCYINSEQGIMLTLSPAETYDLPVGEYPYDVVATVNSVSQVVAKGTLSVTDLGNITPLEDVQEMEIRFNQRTDVRNVYTWRDGAGDVLTVQDAFMQAKDANGDVVLDLRWYDPAPSEQDILLLPEEQRGYLAPSTGATLELHVSDSNPIPAGTFRFDLFVQDSNGDWDILVKGAVVVEESVSERLT